MFKNVAKLIVVFIIGTIGGIFADQILWPYFIERPLFFEYRLEQSPIYQTVEKNTFIQENTALKDAVERMEKTIVGIRTQTATGIFLEGSGLIISSDGLIVTLAELLPRNSDSSFYIDGKKVEFQILKKDLAENLALIQLEEKNQPTCGFFDLNRLKLGERVFLIGIIFEKGVPLKIVNEGIVKGFNEDLIKTNIFEKYTLAGSPLFNVEGEFLGLNTIDKEDRVSAIPVSKIKEFAGF